MTYIERILARPKPALPFSICKADVVGLAFVGSHSHGTYVPPSDPDAIDDVDFMGAIIPPREVLLGLQSFEHWTDRWEELDVVLYDFQKFVKLLMNGNPNVLGLLWLREQDYLLRAPAFQVLIDNRELFNSLRVYESFGGYAAGQLQRMTSFTPELQAEIDTLTVQLIAAGWPLQDVMDGRPLPMPRGMTPDEAKEKAARLKHLRAKFHSAYMGEKRKRLVLKHGYDTKNAAHLVRLLQMCVEFLERGTLQVYREADAPMLKDIKAGKWTLDAVRDHAADLSKQTVALAAVSTLPKEPPRDRIDTLVSETLWTHLHSL